MKNKKLIDSPRYGYILLAMLCIAIALPSFGQFQVNTLGAQLRENLHLSQSQYSSISTAPLLAGVLLGFLSGLLVDRFGLRMVTAAVILSTVGLFLRTFAVDFWSLYLPGILVGFGTTFINATTPKLMSQWFHPEKVAPLMGVVLAASNLALALGTGTAALFGSIRSAFSFTAVGAAVVTVLWLLLVREKRDGGARAAAVSAPIGESLRVVLRDKRVWLCAVFAFGAVVGVSSVSVFLPQALMTLGITEANSGWISMALTLGNTVSCFLSPILIPRLIHTKRQFSWMVLVLGLCSVALTALAWRCPGVLRVVLLFLDGFFGSAIMTFFQSLPTRLPGIGQRYSGTATGLVLTIQLLSSVVLPSYVIAPIAGDNYGLLFLLLGAVGLIPVLLCRVAPVDGVFESQA